LRRWSLLTVCLFLMSCAQVLDIEERQLSGGPATGVDSALCKTYCTEAATTCTREDNAALFETDDACLGTCRAYEEGDVKNPTGNTLACRLDKLAVAKRDGEFATNCVPAGAGGQSADAVDPAASCGSKCENYCALYAEICGATPDCLNQCKALPDVGALDAHQSYISNSDSLQCRLAHVGAAAAAKRADDLMGTMTHCGHSGIKPTGQCNVGDTALHPYNCNDYCRLVTNACTGTNAVYENEAQCVAVCTKGQIPVGRASELQANTLLCRRENGYLALLGATTSCTDAGPAPGRCGNDKCDSYCLLAAAGCDEKFKVTYGAEREAALQQCRAECRNDGPKKIPGSGAGEPYAVNSPAANGGRSMACRIKHVSRVLGENNPGLCDAVFGAAPCQ
jgi:hypothetical protein